MQLVVEVRGFEPLPVMVGTPSGEPSTPDLKNGQRVPLPKDLLADRFVFLVLFIPGLLASFRFLAFLPFDGVRVPLLEAKQAVRKPVRCDSSSRLIAI
jgi:hypothetical protein